jgi:hypothetical protein
MTDLSQAVIHKEGSIEVLTGDRISFGHRGDKVILRGPLHAMVHLKRPNGGYKGAEEIILRSPNETREVVCNENPQDMYDVHITDLGGVPQPPTIMDHVVQKKHLDHNTNGGFTMYHQNDSISLRGPAQYHIEYKNKQGGLKRAEDITLNTMGDIREFVLKAADETLVITGTILGAPSPAQAPVQQYTAAPAQMTYMPAAPAQMPYMPQPAPQTYMAPPPVQASPSAPPMLAGPYAGRLPDGILIKAPNNDSVFVMQGGAKRPLTGEGFNRHGYRWDNIWVLPQSEIDSVPTGPVVN